MISADMRSLAERGCVYTTFLNAKGRFLADALVFHTPTAVLLDVSQTHVPILLPHLLKHRLRSAVSIADVSTSWHTLVGLPRDARESVPTAVTIATTSRNATHAQAHQRIVAVDPRSPRLGVRVLAPASDHGTARKVQSHSHLHRFGLLNAITLQIHTHIWDRARGVLVSQTLLFSPPLFSPRLSPPWMPCVSSRAYLMVRHSASVIVERILER